MSEDDAKVGSLDLSKAKDRNALLRALNEGWSVPPEILKAAMGYLTRVIEDEGRRDSERLKATDLTFKALALKLKEFEQIDKVSRLDDDRPTEGINITVRRTDQLRRHDD